jgi:hypothetical protein
VAVGEGAQVSQEMRDALEQLVRAVQAEQGDVQGFAAQNLPGGFSWGMDTAVKFQTPGPGGGHSYKFVAHGSWSAKMNSRV